MIDNTSCLYLVIYFGCGTEVLHVIAIFKISLYILCKMNTMLAHMYFDCYVCYECYILKNLQEFSIHYFTQPPEAFNCTNAFENKALTTAMFGEVLINGQMFYNSLLKLILKLRCSVVHSILKKYYINRCVKKTQ